MLVPKYRKVSFCPKYYWCYKVLQSSTGNLASADEILLSDLGGVSLQINRIINKERFMNLYKSTSFTLYSNSARLRCPVPIIYCKEKPVRFWDINNFIRATYVHWKGWMNFCARMKGAISDMSFICLEARKGHTILMISGGESVCVYNSGPSIDKCMWIPLPHPHHRSCIAWIALLCSALLCFALSCFTLLCFSLLSSALLFLLSFALIWFALLCFSFQLL